MVYKYKKKGRKGRSKSNDTADSGVSVGLQMGMQKPEELNTAEVTLDPVESLDTKAKEAKTNTLLKSFGSFDFDAHEGLDYEYESDDEEELDNILPDNNSPEPEVDEEELLEGETDEDEQNSKKDDEETLDESLLLDDTCSENETTINSPLEEIDVVENQPSKYLDAAKIQKKGCNFSITRTVSAEPTKVSNNFRVYKKSPLELKPESSETKNLKINSIVLKVRDNGDSRTAINVPMCHNEFKKRLWPQDTYHFSLDQMKIYAHDKMFNIIRSASYYYTHTRTIDARSDDLNTEYQKLEFFSSSSYNDSVFKAPTTKPKKKIHGLGDTCSSCDYGSRTDIISLFDRDVDTESTKSQATNNNNNALQEMEDNEQHFLRTMEKCEGWLKSNPDSTDSPEIVSPVKYSPVEKVSPPQNCKQPPAIYRSICRFFIKGTCYNENHQKEHCMDMVLSKLKLLPKNELIEAYEWSKIRKPLYDLCAETFAQCFGALREPGRIYLVEMITLVLCLERYDRTTCISEIVSALETTGLSFNEAIEHIIIRYGTNNVQLCDILLYLISKSKCIRECWQWVRPIIQLRKEKVDATVVSDLIGWCLNQYPPEKVFLTQISKLIMDRGLVDIDKIPDDLRRSIRVMTRPSTATSELPLDTECEEPMCNKDSFLEDNLESRKRSRNEDYEPEDYSGPISPNSSESHLDDGGSVDLYNTVKVLQQAAKKLKPNSYGTLNDHLKITLDKPVPPKVIKTESKSSQNPAHMLAHPSKQIVFSPEYKCNKSLHHLYPLILQGSTLVDMSQDDLTSLKDAIKTADGDLFLNILKRYNSPYLIKNFILNTFTMLKSEDKRRMVFKFKSIVDAIETVISNPLDDKSVKTTIEVLCLNILTSLESSLASFGERELLLKFRDWNSLVTSQIFENRKYSHMGRYMLLCRVLLKCNDFSWANEILQCDNLKLLESRFNWPYESNISDESHRNKLLDSFLLTAYKQNIVVVNDVFKHIKLKVKTVDGYDVWKTFNHILKNMINEFDDYKQNLKWMYEDITNCYLQLIKPDIFHAFFIKMHENSLLTKSQLNELFNHCCEKEIYQKYQGTEDKVVIRTNMFEFEIRYIFNSFFQKFMNNVKEVHDFCIEINLPIGSIDESIEILKIHRSALQIYTSIRKILKEFGIILSERERLALKIPVTKDMLSKLRKIW